AAWVLDRGIHAAVDATPWLAEHPRLILGSTLLIAGLWQFSPIRDRCLDECRRPLGLVANRWRGPDVRSARLCCVCPIGARCRDAGRGPLGFVANRWRGPAERREAFAMGIAHGA